MKYFLSIWKICARCRWRHKAVSYTHLDKNLEFVPEKGTYAVPYAANAAGILYNKAMFEEHGWKIPTTWNELMSLCQEMQDEGIQPFYFGFKDTWTCLAPWNAIAVDLAPADVCAPVSYTHLDVYKRQVHGCRSGALGEIRCAGRVEKIRNVF